MLKEKVSVFLTVGNQKQKELCEKLISATPTIRYYNIRVVSDDDCGRRLGSGGAVINILRHHYKRGEKMLIVNSGGLSKRSVNYAVRSKAFAEVLYNGEAISLLELILMNAEKIIDSVPSGVLICCSDIVVRTEDTEFCFTDNTGICMKTDFQTASRHGVMLCDEKAVMTDYLHKRDADYLRSVAEKNGTDGMNADTGITYFTDELATVLKTLAENGDFDKLFFEGNAEINLYSDIISLLSKNADKEEYFLTETTDAEHLEVKKLLFEGLSDYLMNVCTVEDEKFLHFGSLKEAIHNADALSETARDYIKIRSYTDDATVVGRGTLLDGVQLSSCSIGKGCIVSDITLEDVSVADGMSVCGIKLCDGSFVTLICDADENPKDSADGASKWEAPRFYKGKSFTESLLKYYENADEQKYSMQYCTDNADYDYYNSRRQYFTDLDSYTVSDSYLKKRKEILDAYFSSVEMHNTIGCLKSRVEISLPLRVNLSGTWTDAMPYCVDNGGQVINMAVVLDGKLPVKVTVERLDTARIEFSSDGNMVEFNNNYDNEEDLSDFNLHKAALRAVGIKADTILESGFRLTTEVKDIDKGSGLGTSSILLGGCIMALSEMFGLAFDEGKILEAVFVAEQIMNTGGGWQDQVGGLTPGIKSGSTVSGVRQKLTVDYIDLPASFHKLFSERLVLLPSGQRHFGRFIVNDVVNRYLSGNKASLDGHRDIRKLNNELIRSIEAEDEKVFCDVINEHRRLLKKISPKVTNPVLDDIIDACMEVACAVSPCGAGGGGYLLVVLKENVTLQQFREFVRVKFPWIKSSVKKTDIYNCYPVVKAD